MIESEVIQKAELLETFPYIDIFSKNKIHHIYKFFYIILRHKTHNTFLVLFRFFIFSSINATYYISSTNKKIKR